MKEHNYYDTFIAVAEDCPVAVGTIPPLRGGKKTVAGLRHELLAGQPYLHTQADILFASHLAGKDAAPGSSTERQALREAFFAKPQACLRACALPKKYGWGIHFDADGKAALYGRESARYAAFIQGAEGVKVVKAMRSSRA